MEGKDITLVIGTYNPNLKWLKNALKSSEGLFKEIILVDDHSDVPVPNSNVRHDVNKKFFEARNTGCRLVKTEWIASLDDDDEFIRENVKELQKLMKGTDADIICFTIEMFDEKGGTAMWGMPPNMNDILNNNQLVSGSWFRKSVFEKLKGFQLSEGEDWDFWARACKHNLKFLYYPKPIYRHRIRAGSMSSNWVGDKLLEIRNNVIANYEKEKVPNIH